MPEPYTVVIGLEVHVQLLTESKLFCGCSTRFGSAPNTQTCPVCIGMPGSLPVMNRRAVELALRTAVALNCEIPHFTKWDRKNYYYPDLPKGYQISQYDLPLSRDGWLEIMVSPLPSGEGPGVRADVLEEGPHPNPLRAPTEGWSGEGTSSTKRIGIIRAHLEEDAGKSMHDEAAGKGDSRIDLNRTGTPLLEIVSQPDLRSPEEAKTYLTELKLLLNYLGVSDCNMQEGSLRVDANVNLHINVAEKGTAPEKGIVPLLLRGQSPFPAAEGIIATPIVEVKNMNSFRAVERALAYEAQRQYREYQETGRKLGEAPKSTRGWDEASQTTRLQRSKEESSDYRYFPDPDLAPVIVTEEEIEQIRADLGELPAALRTRLEQTYGITPYDSDVLVNQGRPLVDYYIELAEACGDGKLASNWVQQSVLRTLNERQIGIAQFPVRPAALAELLSVVKSGKLETVRARDVLQAMLETGKSAAEAMQALGIVEVDDAAVEALCRELLDANPKIVAEVQAGKEKGVGMLIGQAKRKNPNLNAARFRETCLKLIQGMN
ncbi:MAG: Asp-tRNA(Asn)/Glu-tRNA(Gln) amidotransferase subunit GatB [Pirellulales bacterium]|nr:Asp-tRNA(Asn)/Glu-tRNA(Gln) amidotransferase subunit GatB [Pirellulales bacterium]